MFVEGGDELASIAEAGDELALVSAERHPVSAVGVWSFPGR